MFKIYKKLGWYFKQEKYRYIGLVIFCIACVYLMTLPAKYLGNALDLISSGQVTAASLRNTVLQMAGVAIGIYACMNIRNRLMQQGSFKLQYILRNQLMTYLSKMDAHYYNDHETGDLMAVATSDMNFICLAMGQILNQLIYSSWTLVFVLVQMITTINLKLTLVAVVPLPLASYLVYRVAKKLRSLFQACRDAFGNFNNTTLESVAGVQVVRAFVQEKNDIDKLRKVADDVKDTETKALRLDAAFGPIFRTVFSISLVLGMICGVYLVFMREISAGNLVTFNLYLNMLRAPIFGLGMVMNRLQRANASMARFENVTGVEVALEQPEDPLPLDQIDEIEFKDYSFRYPDSKFDSLDHISFKIERGQTIGIIGKTGSGKSTLVDQFLRFYKLGTGEFLINGKSADQYDFVEVRKHFGYVPQEHTLFSKTVKENIELGRVGDVSEEELMEAIHLADFEKDLQFLNNGLDTMCGEDGTMLSGGQKQRLSIARAFLSDPDVLILDDSLSAVDGTTEANIIGNLKEKRQDKTTVIIAHRLSAIQHADLILVFDDGRIIEKGNHESLMNEQGWYYQQFKNQSL